MDNILLTGKTALFPEEALRYISENWSVLVTGRGLKQTSGSLPETVRFFQTTPSDSDFARVFELGQTRAVWHVCSCVDGGRAVNESAQLETILRLCSETGVGRLIILSESSDPTDYRGLIRSLADSSGKYPGVEAAVVRLPLLTGTGLEKGRLNRIFSAMMKGQEIRLDSGGVGQISILPVQELTALLLRMTGETRFRSGIFAADGSEGSLESLREILLSLRPDSSILTADRPAGLDDREGRGSRQQPVRCRIPVNGREAVDGHLDEIYRLPVTISWQGEITSLYAKAQERDRTGSGRNRILSSLFNRFGRAAAVVLDVVVMFFIAEALSRITSESVYFKVVDVRILYVILMGMMHGLGVGSIAAILECIMLVIRYNEIGISGLLLFYNVENWIPFVYYLTAGVISGYSHKKKTQELRAVTAENDLIRSKYLFLNEAYRTSVNERRALRTQILGEEESYARIYGAVRGMSQRTPEAVCVEAAGIMRSLLENETVCIYELDARGKMAELLSCCRENASRFSIDSMDCPEMMQTIRQGEVWKNTAFAEDAPMYARLVSYDRFLSDGSGTRKVSMIVTIEQAEQDQLSSWYSSHFSILCGLFQDALESASLRERIIL